MLSQAMDNLKLYADSFREYLQLQLPILIYSTEQFSH